MPKLTVKIDGMMCGMCEAHLNEAIRKKWPEVRVRSSHRTGTMEIVSNIALSDAEIHEVLDPTGYRVGPIERQNEEKPERAGFISRLFGRK